MTKTPGRLSSRIALVALALAVALPGQLAATQGCHGDLVPNGAVNGADLGAMLSYWGPRTSDPFSIASDIDGDGAVDGADLGTLLANWGYCPATISAVSPAQGCLLGGTVVTITGTWLGSVASVTVGGLPCSGVTVDSATSLRATVPAGASGAADVAVTTLGGTTVSASAFTYRDMVVSMVSPSDGLPAGGTSVTITGECLGNVTAVTVGQAPASAVTVVNTSTVTAVTPPGSLGAANVVLSGVKGSTSVPGGFTYWSITLPPWATLLEAEPDPAVVTNPTLRDAISATGLAWRVRDTATQIEMLLVPPGAFTMGSSALDPEAMLNHEAPSHAVTLTQPFYIGRYEVTQAQWTAEMGSNPSFFRAPEYPDSDLRPVESVSWDAIQPFLVASGMRLPTEAEWEYACRAATTSSRYGALDAIAWWGGGEWSGQAFNGNSNGTTHRVGLKQGNGFGLHDMIGNVGEWVNDRYGDYTSQPVTDPAGAVSGPIRVLRGGSWWSGSVYSRSAVRSTFMFPFDSYPATVSNQYGFRVARTP